MLRIPKNHRDLSRHVLRRELLRIVTFLLWVGAFLAGALYYNYGHRHLPERRLLLGWKLWVWMAAAVLLGFLLFRVWRLFTDRAAHGVITQSTLSRSYDSSKDPGGYTAVDYDFRLNTRLRVTTPSGRRVRMRFEQKNGFYQYYHEGEEILRYRGLPYPINLSPDAPYGYVCVACGRHHDAFSSHCEACGLSMIHPTEALEQMKQ